MLELKNVTKFYNSNGVVTLGLRNINLKLNKGEIVAITGDSGSGKSTLLNVITGVDTYEEGEILFYGNETSYFDGADMDAFRKNNVSFIYQKYNIIDSYTVLENVMIPLTLKGMGSKEAEAEALRLIDRVGLHDRIKHKGSKLSGGEKQRCVIARALASDSQILACDEPTGNLDSSTGAEIIKLIKEVSDDKLVLIVTHNYDQVKDIVTRRIKISDGEIVEDVAFSELEADKNKPMELKSDRMNPKASIGFALKNIKATPKKTLLVFLVFFFVSTIAMIMTLFSFQFSASGNASASFNVLSDNRVIAYDPLLKPIDKSKLDYDNIRYNAFYEDDSILLNLENGMAETFYMVESKINKKLLYGESPKNDNEVAIVYPDREALYSDVKDLIGDKLYMGASNTGVCLGTITAIYQSKEVRGQSVIPYKHFSDRATLEAMLALLTAVYENSDGSTKEIIINDYDDDLSFKTTLYLPKGYDRNNVKIQIGGIYDVNMSYEVKESNDVIPYLLLANPKSESFSLEIPSYMAYIDTNHPDRVEREIESLGLSVTRPSEAGEPGMFDKVARNTYLILTIIGIVAMYFVSYAILARVYQSRVKDYGTLRALGAVKKDLGRMTRIELCSIATVASALGILAAFIIGITTGKPNIDFMNFTSIGFYLIVMILFGLLIANKFNKRLFKFSINKTLRDGE